MPRPTAVIHPAASHVAHGLQIAPPEAAPAARWAAQARNRMFAALRLSTDPVDRRLRIADVTFAASEAAFAGALATSLVPVWRQAAGGNPTEKDLETNLAWVATAGLVFTGTVMAKIAAGMYRRADDAQAAESATARTVPSSPTSPSAPWEPHRIERNSVVFVDNAADEVADVHDIENPASPAARPLAYADSSNH